MTDTEPHQPRARSGRVVILAITSLIALWALVLGALLWRGVHSSRWLNVRDPDAPSQSPELIVVPSRPAPAAAPRQP